MPLRWKRGENPYRLNYFAILQVGAHASPSRITRRRKELTQKMDGGGEHRVDDQVIGKAELAEAGKRLLDPASWAAEVLLVHPPPETGEEKLPELRAAVNEATAPIPSARPLPLANLPALAPLIPRPQVADLPRPSWADLPVPGPDSPQDLSEDLQFDL